MEIGDYQIVKAIRKGTGSSTYIARRKGDKTLVALKNINIGAKDNQKYAYNEVVLLSSLRHPNIVKYCDNFSDEQDSDSFWIVTEMCERGDLAHMLEKLRKGKKYLSEKLVVKLFRQICNALKYCHEKGIIHRDVKSSNIFIGNDNVLKLGDFGISCRVRKDDLHQTQIGSPIIASPEIFRGNQYDFKTDVWSAGCVLYEMMMRKLPFEGSNIIELMNNVVSGSFEPVSSRYSEDLRNLVSVMLEKDPSKRPTISEILDLPIMKPVSAKTAAVAPVKSNHCVVNVPEWDIIMLMLISNVAHLMVNKRVDFAKTLRICLFLDAVVFLYVCIFHGKGKYMY